MPLSPRLLGAAGAVAAVAGLAAPRDPDAELIRQCRWVLARWHEMQTDRHRPARDNEASHRAGDRHIAAFHAVADEIKTTPAATARGALAKLEVFSALTRGDRDTRPARVYHLRRWDDVDEAMLAAAIADLERITGTRLAPAPGDGLPEPGEP